MTRTPVQHLPADLRDLHRAEDPSWWAARQPARQDVAPSIAPPTLAAALDVAPHVGTGD